MICHYDIIAALLHPVADVSGSSDLRTQIYQILRDQNFIHEGDVHLTAVQSIDSEDVSMSKGGHRHLDRFRLTHQDGRQFSFVGSIDRVEDFPDDAIQKMLEVGTSHSIAEVRLLRDFNVQSGILPRPYGEVVFSYFDNTKREYPIQVSMREYVEGRDLDDYIAQVLLTEVPTTADRKFMQGIFHKAGKACLLYTSPSPRD